MFFAIAIPKICLLQPRDKQYFTSNYEDSVLLSQYLIHEFSSQKIKDSLRIDLYGKTLNSSQVLFTIYDFNKKLLYKKRFPASLLKDYGNPIDKEDTSANEVAIKEGFDNFFMTENFFSPAIDPNVEFDNEISGPNIQVWKQIQLNRNNIAFIYNGIDEGHIFIVYLKSKKKVIEFNP